MEVFKTFGKKLEIHATRAYIADISYALATKAARQLDWNQFHITKNWDGTVNASFIISKEVSNELWKFLGGELPPAPLLA
jgi:hypothetical protein